jgi:hypothetical protein
VPARTTVTAHRRPLEAPPVDAASSGWPVGTAGAPSHGPRGLTNEVEQICQRVRELDGPERARVLRALTTPTALSRDEQAITGGRVLGSRHRIAFFLALCCLFLIPWTVGLSLTLPRSYLVGNWPLAWTGFDIILLMCLGTTAWALWNQRQVAAVASLVTSVLLLCDAWFDIVTAHSGRCLAMSVATAVFAEIPIAVLLGLVSVRLRRANQRAVLGTETSSASLWRAPLVFPASKVVSLIVTRLKPTQARCAGIDRLNRD